MHALQTVLPSNAVEIDGARTFTTSLMVAEVFHKRHDHVLRDIDQLDCSPEFRAPNFGETFRGIPGPNNTVRQERYFEISKDGFTFLVMGYRGQKAAQFKEAYIRRFNEMEARTYINPATPANLPTSQQIDKLTASLDALRQANLPPKPKGAKHGWDIPARLQLYFGFDNIGDEAEVDAMLCLLKLQVPAIGGFNPAFEGHTLSERLPDGVSLAWDVRGLMDFLIDYGVMVSLETQIRVRAMTTRH